MYTTVTRSCSLLILPIGVFNVIIWIDIVGVIHDDVFILILIHSLGLALPFDVGLLLALPLPLALALALTLPLHLRWFHPCHRSTGGTRNLGTLCAGGHLSLGENV